MFWSKLAMCTYNSNDVFLCGEVTAKQFSNFLTMQSVERAA